MAPSHGIILDESISRLTGPQDLVFDVSNLPGQQVTPLKCFGMKITEFRRQSSTVVVTFSGLVTTIFISQPKMNKESPRKSPYLQTVIYATTSNAQQMLTVQMQKDPSLISYGRPSYTLPLFLPRQHMRRLTRQSGSPQPVRYPWCPCPCPWLSGQMP